MRRKLTGLQGAQGARDRIAHLLGALRGLERLDSRKVRERWARDGLLREVDLRLELDRVDPLGLAEAEETQGSRNWNFLEIR